MGGKIKTGEYAKEDGFEYYLYFPIKQKLLISDEKILMSAEYKGCAT